jgi:hypothetical protein
MLMQSFPVSAKLRRLARATGSSYTPELVALGRHSKECQLLQAQAQRMRHSTVRAHHHRTFTLLKSKEGT